MTEKHTATYLVSIVDQSIDPASVTLAEIIEEAVPMPPSAPKHPTSFIKNSVSNGRTSSINTRK